MLAAAVCVCGSVFVCLRVVCVWLCVAVCACVFVCVCVVRGAEAHPGLRADAEKPWELVPIMLV